VDLKVKLGTYIARACARVCGHVQGQIMGRVLLERKNGDDKKDLFFLVLDGSKFCVSRTKIGKEKM
jgi:hypothetical protein